MTRRNYYELLRMQLFNERTSFISHWRELGDYILPRRPRFFVSDVNRGDRRNNKIIDNTATIALRNLRSGMMVGVTSPSRPWFKLTVEDPAMAGDYSVKRWLEDVTQRMSDVYLKSNIYNSLPILYGDMGVFATGALLVEEDIEKVINTMVLPVGSYMVGTDPRGKVNVYFREFRMTVRQLVEKFGGELDPETGDPVSWDNFSTVVRNLWLEGQTEQWIDVCHVILPNPNYKPGKIGTEYKKFSSCYYERGAMQSDNMNYIPDGYDKYLRESGYDFFPVLCPRWELTGEDVYGTSCPGMEALGDIKQLQLMEKRGAQAVDKGVNPAMVGPPALKNVRTSILSGDITYVDERDGQKGFRPAHEVNLNLKDLEFKEDQIRTRIKKAFFEDLFLMLTNDTRTQPPTAEEIRERKEEKIFGTGAVLWQLNQDLLNPLSDILFSMMMARGMFPPPPQELSGVELKIEYISIFHQTQKMIGLAGVERFANFTLSLCERTKDNSAMDKINTDEMIDQYGDANGVSPRIIRSQEEVTQIRQQRAQVQQQQHNAEMLQATAKSAKDLAAAKTGDDSALTRLMDSAKKQ